MPVYEYECQKCQIVHEIIQKASDEPIDTCPQCGSPVEKLMSLSSFALKGEGWYTTDYKRQGQKSESSAPTTKAAAGETASSSPSPSTKDSASKKSTSSGSSSSRSKE